MALREQLKREEGLRLAPYRDSLLFWTIGYGHKMLPGEPHVRIDLAEAERLLDVDIAKAESGVRQALPWFDDLDEARQAVLVSMAFQLGLRGLLGFRKTLRYAAAGRLLHGSLAGSYQYRLENPRRLTTPQASA